MYIVLSMMSLFAGIMGVLCIYIIYRNDILKKRNGRFIMGKSINCEELFGQPIRYVMEVEYKINDGTELSKIITTDKKIKKYNNNDSIPLIYVDAIDKVFWAEERSYEKIVSMLLLGFFCGFMFLLSIVCLMKNQGFYV